MPEWKRICCGVDFSPRSRAAMLEAAALTQRLEAELTLVQIHEPRPSPSEEELASDAGVDLLELAAEELHRKLDAWKAEAQRIAGRLVRAAVYSGAPAAEIARFARASGVDAIVLGTHGRTGLSRLVLGSVAERVIRQAHCPVVVVPTDASRG